MPIIRIQDLTGNAYDLGFYNGEYPERVEINDGDVLISWSASLGVYIWNRGKALLNQHIFKVFFDKEPVDKQYFVFAVQHKLNEMESKTHGATMKHIVKKDFDNTLIPFPPIKEQEKIADMLMKALGIVTARQQELQKLDDLIKARFVEMFRSCSSRRRLEEYSVLITKGASPKWQGIDYCDAGTLFVTSENVREGFVDLSKRKYLPNEINTILPRSVLQRNDILINIVGASIGRAAIFESDELANINQAVAIVRLKGSILDLRFLITYLNSEEAQKAYGFMKKGGARDNLSLQNISDFLIPVATIEEQHRFSSFASQVDKSKVVVQKALDEAQLLFDSLMQKYFG